MLDDLIFGVFRLLVSWSPSDLLQITEVTVESEPVLLVLLSFHFRIKKGHKTMMSCLFSCLYVGFNSKQQTSARDYTNAAGYEM